MAGAWPRTCGQAQLLLQQPWARQLSHSLSLTFPQVLLQLQHPPVLPQHLPVPPELQRRQHLDAQLVAGSLTIRAISLQGDK